MNLLTTARDLQRRRARERQGRFVAEGIRAVDELLRSPLRSDGILVDAATQREPRIGALLDRAAALGILVTSVSSREFHSAAETDAPQGILAIAPIPAASLEQIELRPGAPLVVLDALQDPGNAGTIVRTAAALGASGVVALPGTVDLWNAKVVRGGMGAHFRNPPCQSTTDELVAFLAKNGAELWIAGANGEQLGAATPPPRLAVAIGNEGAGIGSELANRASRRVTIPIAPGVQSLNAAVAAGILLYNLRS